MLYNKLRYICSVYVGTKYKTASERERGKNILRTQVCFVVYGGFISTLKLHCLIKAPWPLEGCIKVVVECICDGNPEFILRRLEIVFIFTRLVLQILFQIQFGLSYQCEIYHRHIFSRKPVTVATMWCIQLYPQNRKLPCYWENRLVKSSQTFISHVIRNDHQNM